MRENLLLKAWREGRGTVNGWCAIPSSFSAELMAHAGFDSVTIDLQHGLIDQQAAVAMLQAISTTPTVPLVRVPWLEAGSVMKALDAGAMGIICPMVNSAEEAARLVAYAKYAPLGQRSFGPIRSALYAGPDWTQANETTLALAMIETRQAMDNLDEIAATPGLDGLYVGPSDLAISLGETPHMSPTNPVVVAAIDRILSAAKANGLWACVHCGSSEFARAQLDKGFNLATIQSDAAFISMEAARVIQAVGLERDSAPPSY